MSTVVPRQPPLGVLERNFCAVARADVDSRAIVNTSPNCHADRFRSPCRRTDTRAAPHAFCLADCDAPPDGVHRNLRAMRGRSRVLGGRPLLRRRRRLLRQNDLLLAVPSLLSRSHLVDLRCKCDRSALVRAERVARTDCLHSQMGKV